VIELTDHVMCHTATVRTSVALIPFTDPSSGAAGLRVIENGQNDAVTITDNSTAHTTTVVADGKKQAFDHQFTVFDLKLVGKKDALTFDLAGAFSQRLADLLVRLGNPTGPECKNMMMTTSFPRVARFSQTA